MLFLNLKKKAENFQKEMINSSLVKNISNALDYSISTSNQNIKDYETLSYHIKVIKDQYPKISVKQQKDSLTDEMAFHFANITDDYGLIQCQLVYYTQEKPEDKKPSIFQ